VHEGAIAEALVEQVRRWLPADAVLRRVHLEIGRLEHVEPSPLRLHWTALTLDTDLGDAELVIEHVPLVVRCGACGHEHEPDEPSYLICPECGSARPEVIRGAGVVLRRLEADQPEGDPDGHPGRRERAQAQ